VDPVGRSEAASGVGRFRVERDTQPASVPLWRELFAGMDWLGLRLSPVYYGFGVSAGDGAAVVLVPGFLGTDFYLREFHCWLKRIGYRAYLSGIGRNADCLDLLMDRLLVTVHEAFDATRRRVHLVGHSLGGILARSAATRRPDLIASVITLGSPFRGIRSHPLVMAASERVRVRITSERSGRDDPACFTGACTCPTVRAWAEPFPADVAQLAIYTKSDGVVDWRFCITGDPERDAEVPGTHVGLAFNPFVYRLVSARLARVSWSADRVTSPPAAEPATGSSPTA
jgi:pimeloyl-ACP methyl ester carboxylesterase